MKKQIQFFALVAMLLISSLSWGQIQQNDTSICIGSSVNLNCNSPFSVQSCTGTSPFNFTNWTEIASTSSYWNIIKEGNTYFLRSDTDVYQSSSLNGPWTSLGFNTQIGNTLAGRMLGKDWSNRLIVSTGHNALYALNNGTWSDIGLSGSGCSGNFIHKLANNRIIVMKGGFLRDLYISDNNGTTWTNVTNVDNDYWDMIVAANGNIFACGGSNTLSMTGIIKSTDNGSSFTQINAQLGGISRCSGLSKDCDNNLYAVGDNTIFKSTDNGTSWANHCIIPSYFTTNPSGSFLVIASNGDYYFWGYSSNSMHGLFRSSNQGQTWNQITDLPTSTANVRTIKEIDGNIVIPTSEGIFARTLTPNNTYLWSTGETASSINVQPSQNTQYFVTITSSAGVVVNDSVTINVSNPQFSLGSDQSICSGNQTTLASSDNGFSSYNWNNGEISSSINVNQAGQFVVNIIDSIGCTATDTVNVAIINPTIIAGASAFCLGDSTTLSIQTTGISCNIYPTNLLDGLTGWWTFCGNANDESGNGHPGIINGATLTDDRFGTANRGYQFDGVNDFIKVNNIYDYSNKTINTWFNAAEIYKSGNSAYQIFDIDAQSLSYGRTSTQIESGILYVTGGGELASYAIPIDSNQWYMLTMTRTPTVIKYYLNGSYLGEVPSGISTSTTNDNPNLLIGVDRAETVQFFKGKIDEVGIWNRDLSAQEIEQLFYHGNLNTWWSDGTTNQSSIQVQPTQTTTYSVTVSDGVGTCADSITIQVNNPQINAGSDLSVCEGETASLTATGADTYAWDNGVVNGQPFTPTIDGYYTVVGTDTLGCSNTVSVFLDVLQPTSSTISPISCDTYTAQDNEVYTNSGQYTAIIPNAAGCDSTITINLTINNSNSGIDSKTACDSYTWIDGNTYTESTNSATFTMQNASGCDSVVTLNLTINKLQTLNAGSDQTVCKGENVTLTASGAETYSWNNGVSDAIAFSPPLGTTTYTVTGTDGNGCTDTDEVIVTSEYCFEIPGALSPNSDNNNDTWEISGLQNYPNAIISVFDRWGQKVFEGTSTSAPWDGKHQDKDLPTADYYYVIELGNGDNYNGVVTLKR